MLDSVKHVLKLWPNYSLLVSRQINQRMVSFRKYRDGEEPWLLVVNLCVIFQASSYVLYRLFLAIITGMLPSPHQPGCTAPLFVVGPRWVVLQVPLLSPPYGRKEGNLEDNFPHSYSGPTTSPLLAFPLAPPPPAQSIKLPEPFVGASFTVPPHP